jgi:hypothetical protein
MGMGVLAKTARYGRTLASLRPLQVIARPYAVVSRRFVGLVPSGAPPKLRGGWGDLPPAFEALVHAEVERAGQRASRIPENSLLARYEAHYGIGDAAGTPGFEDDPAALHPFPSSVRARNLAVAVRRGVPVEGKRLARACRAVLAQLELHLLGNHYLENGFGLACAGCVAEGAEAELWWRIGRAILSRELEEQFLPDGGHFERSGSYHLWLTTALLVTIELAHASGRRAPASWRETAARAVGWIEAVRAPDGTYPLFNDAALDASPLPDQVLGLAKDLGIEPIRRVVVHGNGEKGVLVLPHTGWCVVRHGAAWLVMDAGPDGAPYQPGHVHADALTFELWLDGERTVVDYGVSSYVDDEERRRTRATISHNTVEVDGRDSSEVWGSFRVGRRATGRIVEVGETTVTAEHDGYGWLPGAPIHRRVVRVVAGGVDVEDDCGGFPSVSTIRCDAGALERRGLRVVGVGGEVREEGGAWYPSFGERREARVFRLVGRGGKVGWELRW